MERLIFHVDVNSAYLSWEAARQVAEGKPDLRLIPSAIGGDREKRTGVILAKSIPAKKMGVKTGEPVGMALRKCPELILAKPDFRLYETNSKAFMDICRRYAPIVEKYSIDECFLDMSGTGVMYPDPIAIAAEIKDTIHNELGFTVNVGISDCKILAKMASDFEKPDKIHTLFPNEIEQKMWPLPVNELFSVGYHTAEKLRKAAVQTIGDLAKLDLGILQGIVGRKLGLQLHNYANGIDDAPVLSEPEAAKGYSNSVTLETDVTTAENAYSILLAISDSVTARMRLDEVKAYCVSVTIRGNDFKDRSHQRKLMEATDITQEVYEVSKQLFNELWKGMPLRLLGISLTELVHKDEAQTSLFPDERKEKAGKIDQAVDKIRGKYGTGTIMRGSTLETPVNVGKRHKVQMDMERKKEK